MPQCLTHKHVDLSLIPQNLRFLFFFFKILHMMGCTFHLSTGEVEAQRFLGFTGQPAQPSQRVPGPSERPFLKKQIG